MTAGLICASCIYYKIHTSTDSELIFLQALSWDVKLDESKLRCYLDGCSSISIIEAQIEEMKCYHFHYIL